MTIWSGFLTYTPGEEEGGWGELEDGGKEEGVAGRWKVETGGRGERKEEGVESGHSTLFTPNPAPSPNPWPLHFSPAFYPLSFLEFFHLPTPEISTHSFSPSH